MKMKDMNEAKQVVGLGDVVAFENDLFHDYNQSTVSQVHKDGTVDLFRVYVHSNDFSCAGRHEGSLSVICYIGTETIRDVNPEGLRIIRKNTTPIR